MLCISKVLELTSEGCFQRHHWISLRGCRDAGAEVPGHVFGNAATCKWPLWHDLVMGRASRKRCGGGKWEVTSSAMQRSSQVAAPAVVLFRARNRYVAVEIG